MFMLRIDKFLKSMGAKGQSVMEVAILFAVIVFALISMQTYLKRGIQGFMKGSIEELGDQYDPNTTTSDYESRHYANMSTTTITSAQNRSLSAGRYANVMLSIANTQIYYDNTITNGYATVGP